MPDLATLSYVSNLLLTQMASYDKLPMTTISRYCDSVMYFEQKI